MAELDFYRSNTSVSYPFENSTSDIKSYFVDAYVNYCQNDMVSDKRVKLTYFDVNATPKRVILAFEDNTILADLSGSSPTGHPVAFKSSTFGDYTIYEWRKISTIGDGFTGDEIIIRFVILTAVESSQYFPLEPTNTFLISSLVNPHMKRVRKLGVKQPDLDCCTGLGEGFCVLEAGNNIKLSINKSDQAVGLGLPQTQKVRTPSKILVDVIPGAGSGKKQICLGDDLPILTINNIPPSKQGNFKLYGQDCIWLERPIESIVPSDNHRIDYEARALLATLKFHADCKACCDCDDYGRAYAELSSLWDRALAASKRIEDARKKYNKLLALLKDIRAKTCLGTSEDKVQVYLDVITRPDYHYAVGMAIRNNTDQTFNSVRLTITIDAPNSITYTERSGFLSTPDINYRQVDPVGSNPYSVTIPRLKPGEVGEYTFEGRFYSGHRANIVVRATGTANTPVGNFTVTKQGTLTKPLLKT